MPATDPTSRRLLPLKHMRILVSRSAAWQAHTGLNEAGSLGRCHYAAVDPDDETMPFCIVGLHEDPPDDERDTLSTTRTNGTIILRFLSSYAEGEPVDQRLFTLGDIVSNICDEIFTDAVGDFGMRLKTKGRMSDPMESDEDETRSRGFYAYVEVAFDYWD